MCLSDGTAGGENEHCGPCLVGEAWDRLRATLGTEEVRRARSTVPTIKHAQWLSSTLAGTVIHILLKVRDFPNPVTTRSLNQLANYQFVN
jgi:hypothetical protein